MKRELALQLLQASLPDLSEQVLADLFRDLQFLADYKYNKYEMYYPGRLFLENLYLWLEQFEPDERPAALSFVRNDLIFVSREEFQQLAHILYHDVIRKEQFDATATMLGVRKHRVRVIGASPEFSRVARASLYVAMSDGSRIDYIRRQHLEINNEQVLPHYEASAQKVAQLLRDLRSAVADPGAFFRCAFFIDDFCGSGKTLLREVVVSDPSEDLRRLSVPASWLGRLRVDRSDNTLQLNYDGGLTARQRDELLALAEDEGCKRALASLVAKSASRATVLKGALAKIASGSLRELLDPAAQLYFSPLVCTEHALQRLKPLIEKLPDPFARMNCRPAAIIDSSVEVTSAASAIGTLCEKYYGDELADQHTGNVQFGFDLCGLPLVLHHNTPNNSLYLLWNRRAGRSPLFVRYERHGREGA